MKYKDILLCFSVFITNTISVMWSLWW